MKFATNPSRNSPAATRMAPTSSVSVASATTSPVAPRLGARGASAAVRMAMVVVVLDAQGPRRTEQGVERHRHQRGVEPHLHRQARNGGVGQGLGDHHRGGGQARDEVGASHAAW